MNSPFEVRWPRKAEREYDGTSDSYCQTTCAKLRTRNNPRYSWMDCGVPTSILCPLPPVELRSEPFRMPGMWQRVPLGEREGLQRLAGAKHGTKSLARTLLSLTVFYFCSTAWIWALDPGRRISQYAHT